MTVGQVLWRWTAAGLACEIRAGQPALCGYVQAPTGLRGWTRQRLNEHVRAPGGLTYGPDLAGWVGFDTSHAFDWWPLAEVTSRIPPDGLAMAAFTERLAGKYAATPAWRRWTVEGLRTATTRLAADLAGLADPAAGSPGPAVGR